MFKRLLFCSLALTFCTGALAADKIPVVNEGGISNNWTLAPGATLPAPAYPEIYRSSGAEVCVAIGYLLNEDGTTSDFSLLRSWSSDEPSQAKEEYWSLFANDASNALARWKFAPKPEVTSPKPVYTVATFLFGAKDVASLRSKCAISDLALHIVQIRADRKTRRRLDAFPIYDRLDIDPAMVNRVDQQYRAQRQSESQMSRDQRNSGNGVGSSVSGNQGRR